MNRGFAAVALHNPKGGYNVGGAMRAAWNYRAAMVVVGGPRGNRLMRHGTDTAKTWRSVPVVMADDVLDAIPYDCIPIAVDLVPDAVPLFRFTHPERAFYVFGPEDGTLGGDLLRRCVRRVMIPMCDCANLAVTVATVLYDRRCKEWLAHERAAQMGLVSPIVGSAVA